MRRTAIVFALLGAAPATAHAATAPVSGSGTTLTTTSNASVNASSDLKGTVRLKGPGIGLAAPAPANCSEEATTPNPSVVCSGYDTLDFEFGDGNQSIDLSSFMPLRMVANGGPGNDRLQGGELGDQFDGGPGDDTLVGWKDSDTLRGGDGNDLINGQQGRDVIDGGSGLDTVLFDGPGAWYVNLAAGTDSDGDLLSGLEGVITSTGNDRIIGSPAEDSIQSGAGDDQIDVRDSRVDTVDCGPGFDTVLADPGDTLIACEAPPADADGDGSFPPEDCNDRDPDVKPTATELRGNSVDENCDGIVLSPGTGTRLSNRIQVRYATAKAFSVFTKLRVLTVAAATTVEVRCSGHGCPFGARAVPAVNGTSDIGKLLKGRKLKPGAVVEIRITEPQKIGKVVRYKVRRGLVPLPTTLCLAPNATTPQKRCSATTPTPTAPA